MSDIFFADISNFQASVDLATYRQTNAIIIEQATWGESITDPNGRLALIRSLDFQVVCWYLGVLAGETADGQVAAFMSAIGGELLPGETVALDWEATNGVMPSAQLRDQIANQLAGELGIPVARVGVYGSPSNLAADPALGWQWVADYGDPEPSVPHVMWQFTNGQDGSPGYPPVNFPGIGFCDGSVFHGSPSDLEALIVPGTTPVPPTPSEDPMLGVSPAAITPDTFQHRAAIGFGNRLIHIWTDNSGVPQHEDVAIVAAGPNSPNPSPPIAALQFDGNQVPTCQIIGNQLFITAQTVTEGFCWAFVQTIGKAGWGASQLL